MILSHERRFLFVHMPKTAGTSMREQLHRLAPDSRVASIPFNSLGHSVHSPARVLRRHLRSRWSGYFKFGFVRNPWDAAVSIYFYNAISCADSPDPEDRRRSQRLREKFPRIQDFLKSDFRLGLRTPLIRSSRYYFYDALGRPLLDYIGRFEDLPTSYAHVLQRLGLPNEPLPRCNETPHAHYGIYYDHESIANVGNRLRWDVERFGYRFDYERSGLPAKAADLHPVRNFGALSTARLRRWLRPARAAT